ncbi:GTP cyclohydrolase I FolE [Varibaculum vaginae]|uniref:GTP cyclohydrolase I FolE n=1 Tax=Varibaculum vaginae TaxID=2364797 RepID=UPI000F074328|nr:GTP cyclohydrolase I FolE [Varibaculum vaginae]
MTYNQKGVEQAIRDLLVAIGEDPEREGLQETPARMGRAWKEIISGMHSDPALPLEKQFQVDDGEMVMVRGIPFYSLCEHHLLPFFGVAHVAYIPRDGRITGLSKLARVVEGFSHRLQVQERLTAQIADALMERLKPRGAAVVIEGEHLCMSMRGIKKPGASTTTSALRGVMRSDPRSRAEVLSLIRGN